MSVQIFKMLFNAVILIIGGVLTLFFPKQLIDLLFIVFLLLVTIKLVSNVFEMSEVKNYKRALFYFWISAVLIAVSFIFYKFKESFVPIIRIALGLYFVLDTINRIICLILTYKENIKRASYYFISAFLTGSTFVLLLFFDHIRLTSICVSLYLIFLGISYLSQFILSVFSYRLKWSRPVVVPAIVALFLPYLLYKKLLFKRDNGKTIVTNLKKSDAKPDLYISIHVGPKPYSRVGHIDICFDDVTYSYGQYDKDSLSFFKIFGDGVIYKVKDREKYYEFVRRIDKKIVIEYGFKLSDLEKEKIRNRINKLFENTTSWSSPYDYTYAHKLEEQVGAKLYKFNGGKLKKYYSVTNNCVLLIDILGRGIVTDKIYSGSFIIPGSYLHYFNEQLKLKKSKVISRNIYM